MLELACDYVFNRVNVNACINISNCALTRTHILSVYIYQVGVNQQLFGRACWCWMRGLRAGDAV